MEIEIDVEVCKFIEPLLRDMIAYMEKNGCEPPLYYINDNNGLEFARRKYLSDLKEILHVVSMYEDYYSDNISTTKIRKKNIARRDRAMLLLGRMLPTLYY